MQSTQCMSCKHHIVGDICEAFHEGIPREILRGQVEHNQPYPGDNGLRYERDSMFDELGGIDDSDAE